MPHAGFRISHIPYYVDTAFRKPLIPHVGARNYRVEPSEVPQVLLERQKPRHPRNQEYVA